ncbi:hypothetical protein [Chelatococcus asaccharovorans]|uniref:Uncharacterized protein n=1 Tax=Chelatococcus asaccharovorans TaxID=28210 RepID=A0A2V3U5B3_9HYPH|nr:hypothetical protein [Chelatococcus asaccharovorans]MBS7703964.1 hypothetical protein [Chelatococcus asaccharovorans]PXW58129.1 hypothetical protein C7450_106305 [Chelatococcus asaccharovorans]
MKPRLIALYAGIGLALSAGPAFATDPDLFIFQQQDTARMQQDHNLSGIRDAQENVKAYQRLLNEEQMQQHAAPAPQTHPTMRQHHTS